MDGDEVDLLVNDIESDRTKVAYAFHRLPFTCPPRPETRPVQPTMGEILNGDRLWRSDYELSFGIDTECRQLCNRVIKKNVIQSTAKLVADDYTVNWFIDDLPGATTLIKPKTAEEAARKYYIPGFALGFVKDGKSYLHNHVMLVIRWNADRRDPSKKYIVGFEVYPKSVADAHCPGAARHFDNFLLDPSLDEQTIPFTYSIYWREDPDVTYNTRHDMYMLPGATTSEGRAHWFAMINSLILVSLLSVFVAVVLMKTLKRGAASAAVGAGAGAGATPSTPSSPVKGATVDAIDTQIPGATSGYSWTKLTDEVFVQPTYLGFLCMLAGSGAQLLFTIAGICVLMSTGMKAPTGSIINLALALFIFAGFFAGFVSVQFYKRFSVELSVKRCLKVAVLSGSVLSALCISILVLCNLATYEKASKNVVHPSTVFGLLGLYLAIQLPLSLIGGYISVNTDVFEEVLHNKNLPPTEYAAKTRRYIPVQPRYNNMAFALPVCGLFPFGIVFVEMVFLYRTMWIDTTSFHEMYGFLLLTTVLLLVVVGEISVITTYLRLNAGDYYNWQWKSFVMCSCSILVYLVAYTIYYLIRMKMVDAVSPLLYLTYSMMFNVLVAVACGSFGLTASTIFVYSIYSSRKND